MVLAGCGDNSPSPAAQNQSTTLSNQTQPQAASSTTLAAAVATTQGPVAAATPTSATASTIDWKQVEQAMGKAGAMQPGGVYKFSFPRSDLQVTKNGVQLKAGFALGSHVEFLPMGNQVMVMVKKAKVPGYWIYLPYQGGKV